jgi:hypothetical protein
MVLDAEMNHGTLNRLNVELSAEIVSEIGKQCVHRSPGFVRHRPREGLRKLDLASTAKQLNLCDRALQRHQLWTAAAVGRVLKRDPSVNQELGSIVAPIIPALAGRRGR